MGILKTLLLGLLVCIAVAVNGQTEQDTSKWYIYLYEDDKITSIEHSIVKINDVDNSIEYISKDGRVLVREEKFFLSRQKLSNEIVLEYIGGIE